MPELMPHLEQEMAVQAVAVAAEVHPQDHHREVQAQAEVLL